MKKEIEVYIYKHHLPWFLDNCNSISIHKNPPENSGPLVKARLIIEEEEKKIEITEAQFDEAWRKAVYEDDTKMVVSYIKNELFGER